MAKEKGSFAPYFVNKIAHRDGGQQSCQAARGNDFSQCPFSITLTQNVKIEEQLVDTTSDTKQKTAD